MVEAIRQIHDGIRACVRIANGVCSEWFEVAQGLRQGCTISPLLFNVFFAAILLVALLLIVERFNEDTDKILQILPISKSGCQRLP